MNPSTLPHDAHVEKALLACLFLKPELLRRCDLDVEAFYDPLHRVVYQTLLDLDQDGYPPDMPLVVSRIQSSTDENRAPEIAAFLDVCAVTFNFDSYLDRLKRVAYQRALVMIEEETCKLAQSAAPEEVEAQRERRIRKARERYWPGETAMEPAQSEAKLREFYNQTRNWSVETGWPSVDSVIGPLHPGTVITALARPGVGKSALGLNLAANWLRTEAEWGVLFASLEMEETLATDRLMRILQGWSQREVMNAMRTGIEPTEFRRLTANRFCLFAQARQPLSAIERSVEIWERRHARRIRAVVIDYFQYLAGDRRESPYERSARLSREVKEFAKTRELLVVNLCQVSRGEAGGQGTSCPSLEGARDSGTIEENADVLIGLWRPKDQPNSLMLKVLKARSGPVGGKAEIAFEADTMRLVETTRDPVDRSSRS